MSATLKSIPSCEGCGAVAIRSGVCAYCGRPRVADDPARNIGSPMLLGLYSTACAWMIPGGPTQRRLEALWT